MISKSIPVYSPEVDLLAPVEMTNYTITFETFFWCISMCIATFLIILIMEMIHQED